MENSVADVQLAREGHTARVDYSYAAPALTTPMPFAVSSSVKVAMALAVVTWLLSRDTKLTMIVVLTQLILSMLLK